jgi:hypothetical protein
LRRNFQTNQEEVALCGLLLIIRYGSAHQNRVRDTDAVGSADATGGHLCRPRELQRYMSLLSVYSLFFRKKKKIRC